MNAPARLHPRRLAVGLAIAGTSALGAAALARGTAAEPQRVAAPPASQDATAIPVPNVLVPFVVEIPGGLANSAGFPSANPEIRIDSDGTAGCFVVNSILVKTDFPATGIRFLSASEVHLDGTAFDARTENLVGHLGTNVDESADLMGAPIRTGSSGTHVQGGCFPHELIVESADADDIRIRLFARSDDADLLIQTVRVAGYKRPGDAITVTYVPGS